MIIALKILLALFFILIFLLAAYQTRKSGSLLKVLGYILLELMLTIGVIFLSFLILNYNLKKAVATEVKNTRILSREELVVSGYVQNVGKYVIDNAYLKIKIIHAASGQTRDVLRNKDGTKKESTFIKTIVIAKNLHVGEKRRFQATIKYPPYFRLADIITKLSWD